MSRETLRRHVRAHGMSARALGEFRVQRLLRARRGNDLRRCMEYVRTGSMFIDVGASVGDFSIAGSRRVGSHGTVLALEPNPQVFQDLTAATWGTRVTPLNLAASSGSGWATLHVPRDRVGRSRDALGSLERRSAGDVLERRIRTVRLDDLVGEGCPVSAIKIDVEGHELAVLEGAAAIVDRCHPALVVEIEARHCVDHEVGDVIDWFTSRGYDVRALNGDSLMPWEHFDVTANQTQWLDEDGPAGVRAGAPYINNFLCTPRHGS